MNSNITQGTVPFKPKTGNTTRPLSITQKNAYDSLANFIATLDPKKVLEFHAPESIQNRVEELLYQKEQIGLKEQEQEELNHYFILEHIVRLAKSKVRLALSQNH